mmetsp:Transcript_14577/g.23934  ORF Transcript_14577/g.23934 Transcript_14577/m.23934 type:complete len:233 (+) Transcript_14577:727-1425(+)
MPRSLPLAPELFSSSLPCGPYAARGIQGACSPSCSATSACLALALGKVEEHPSSATAFCVLVWQPTLPCVAAPFYRASLLPPSLNSKNKSTSEINFPYEQLPSGSLPFSHLSLFCQASCLSFLSSSSFAWQGHLIPAKTLQLRVQAPLKDFPLRYSAPSSQSAPAMAVASDALYCRCACARGLHSFWKPLLLFFGHPRHRLRRSHHIEPCPLAAHHPLLLHRTFRIHADRPL